MGSIGLYLALLASIWASIGLYGGPCPTLASLGPRMAVYGTLGHLGHPAGWCVP